MSAGQTRRNRVQRGRGAGGTSMPVAQHVTLNGNSPTLWWAQKAIEVLMENGGFVADTKAQFALRMGWIKAGTGAVDEPDRRLVEDVCNLTRDLSYDAGLWPAAAELLAGFVISYAPNRGGMTLLDPDGDQPLHHLTHILLGDLQKQSGMKTINRRRLPTWEAAADNALSSGDVDLGRLFDRAAQEIKKTGFVDDQTINTIYKTADSRGLLVK